MSGSFIAEMDKLIRRPAAWVLILIPLALSLVFNYLVPYTSYLSTGNERAAERMLASAMPGNLILNSIGGFPVFAGAIALALGALSAGSEYGWGTLKTALTQRPRRIDVYAGKLAALAVVMLAIVLGTFTLGALTSSVIAINQSEALDWPSPTELMQGIASGWLILMAWCLFGVMLAFVLRGTALPIGLGIVWVMGIENLIVNVAAPLLDFADTLQKVLPGVNAGSLVAALSVSPGAVRGTPGLNTAVDGTQAMLVLIAYAVVFALIAGFTLKRRDVT